jgi:hypothetical protein
MNSLYNPPIVSFDKLLFQDNVEQITQTLCNNATPLNAKTSNMKTLERNNRSKRIVQRINEINGLGIRQ